MAATAQAPRVGAVEAGGTKCICAVGCTPEDLRKPENRLEIHSDEGAERVIARVLAWFGNHHAIHPLQAIGIASFGPLELSSASPSFGRITSTPKLAWRNTDWLGPFQEAFPALPIAIDTDVNGAALGEGQWGAACGVRNFIYITMGTGIGGGAIANGQLIHGLLHPEMGHMRIPRIAGDSFAGICPFHGDCWEGLCSGPAIAARTGMPAEDLPADHAAWSAVARYTAYAIGNLVCALSPQRIVVGGSVRKAGRLGEAAFFGALRRELATTLNGYIASAALGTDAIGDYIVPPALGDDAGLCGALALAQAKLGSVLAP